MRRAGYRFLRTMRAMLPVAQDPATSTGLLRVRLLRWTRANLVPRSEVWVQVEHGLAEGLWMRLHLPEETFLWRGDHEPDVQALLAKFLKPGSIAYDVGSYVGFFALGMARVLGRQGQVFAFEPDPDNALRIREHIVKNSRAAPIQVVEAAVWRAAKENT